MLLPFDSHRKAHQKTIHVHYKYTESMFNLIQMHRFWAYQNKSGVAGLSHQAFR